MADKWSNLISPDTDDTEGSKRCKQLCSEALTSKKYAELIKKIVSQGFDSDWNVVQQLNWLHTKKEPERFKFLAVCAYSWICKMGGVPLTPEKKIPDVTEGWYSLTAQQDKICEITGIDVGFDLSSWSKGLEVVCEKADRAMSCKLLQSVSALSTSELSSQTVQAAATSGTTPQTENQTDSPYTEMCSLLNVAAANTLHTYAETPELPTMQAKPNTGPEVRNLCLTPMELNVVTSRGTVSAAPVRRSDNVERNTEVGDAFELGEWTRLSASEKNSLFAGLEPFKLFHPNKVLWDKIEAVARQQNLGIADVQVLVESLVPSSKLCRVQGIEFGPRAPVTWGQYCMAYSDYKRQVKEILGLGSFPWTSVTQVKKKPGESPLEYVERFQAAYENYCAADDNDEDYDSAIVIESATGGLSKVYRELLISGSVHIPNWECLVQWCAVCWSRLQANKDQNIGEVSAAVVEAKTNLQNNIECYQCGRKGHLARSCRTHPLKCHKCGKLGHSHSV
ncbi:uncharacterized protein [Chanodichthys erythropterus]|uniref:uncharacterized protein n=1 Tax=Chanodichthys erythropterus TaxID=933992 RepID=UPI00351E3046